MTKHAVWRGGFVLLVLPLALGVACGGNASDGNGNEDDAGSGLSRSELEQRMVDEVDKLNSCTVVTDCAALALPQSCKSFFVNKGADRSTLDGLIEEYRTRFDPDMGCIDICQCGVLTCKSGRCSTSAGDCMTPPGDDQQQVCL